MSSEALAQPHTGQPTTGLDEIRLMTERGIKPPMMDLLGIDLTAAEEGRVVFTATPSRRVYNPLGIAHGGFAATMLDSACGLAAKSATRDLSDCVTLELKISYHAPLDESVGEVRAIGTVVSMGRRVAHTRAEILDAGDRLYASATSTLLLAARAPRSNSRSNQG